YRWMGGILPYADSWVWAMRALPALFGSLMIPLGYGLGRLAVSPRVGLATAALIAVSPCAVYLSQEARHYTLPMALIAVALGLLLRLQQAPESPGRRTRGGLWVAWAIVNLIGLYVHYFFLLTVVAQAIAFSLWVGQGAGDMKPSSRRTYLQGLGIALVIIVLGYLPWLPTMLSHLSRPETDWLKPYNPDWRDRLAPLYQIPSGWILSVVALPLENQPTAIAVPAAIGMLVVGVGLGGYTVRGLWQLRRSPAIRFLATFVGGVLLQFLAIVYVLDKDITAIPRYNFVYYPALVVLIAAGLTASPQKAIEKGQRSYSLWSPITVALLAGVLSSLLVVQGIVFQKGYRPDQVAQDIIFEVDVPILMAVSYQSLQEVALGLSFALELQRQTDRDAAAPSQPVALAFVYREGGYGPVWQQFLQLQPDLPLPLNLWVVASPGMKTKDYPNRLRLRIQTGGAIQTVGIGRCAIVPERFNRIGFPYQLFRCQAPGQPPRQPSKQPSGE
ncbi:MAG: glycosyltransferase family 39 protein, partial [Elainellaceae cyanobacterium]